MLGAAVGDFVGELVGAIVGDIVGPTVGCIVGEFVGAVVIVSHGTMVCFINACFLFSGTHRCPVSLTHINFVGEGVGARVGGLIFWY
jgi:hypothetical protein